MHDKRGCPGGGVEKPRVTGRPRCRNTICNDNQLLVE